MARRGTTCALPGITVALAAALVLGCGSSPARAQAGSLYVDAGGHGASCSDARSAVQAQAAATPLCTIGRAIAVAPSGARVVVRGGTYPAVDVTGGSRTSWVTVGAAQGEAVTVPSIRVAGSASWLRFERLRLTAPFRIEEGRSAHIAIVGSTIASSGGGDLVSIGGGSSDVLVEANSISGGGNGVVWAADQSTAPVTNVTVRNNRIANVGTDALRPANFAGALIEGNEISGVVENGDHSDALQSYAGGRNLVFRGNYVHDNDSEGFFIKDGHVDDVTIENNVIVNNRSAASQIKVYDTTGLRLINNTVWNNQANVTLSSGLRNVEIRNNIFEHLDADASIDGVVQEHNLIGGSYGWHLASTDVRGAPTFVAPGSRDYRLAAGSRGIDMGTASGAPSRDKACRARWDDPAVANTGAGSPPYVDAGALERNPASTAGDTAALAGCVSSPISPPASPGAGQGCAVSARRVRHGRLRLRHARVRARKLRVTVRASAACRLRIAGTAVWGRGHHRHHARIRAAVRRVRPGDRRRIGVRLPRRAVHALRHHRHVRLHLRVRASGGGAHRTFKRTVRLHR